MAYTLLPKILTKVIPLDGEKKHTTQIPIASSNKQKLAEFEAMGLSVMPGISVEEIQDRDPYVVVTEKAKQAFIANGCVPTLVEDTSFEVDSMNGLPGPFVKFFLGERSQREALCISLPKNSRGVTMRTLLAVFDGQEVTIEEGITQGTIAPIPQGPATFAFDDIFIPVGSKKTYAEMTLTEKNKTSSRMKAVKKWLKKPITLQENVYQLAEPTDAQTDLINTQHLAKYPKAVQFAFSLGSLMSVKSNKDFLVTSSLAVYKKNLANGKIVQYIVGDKNTAGQGLVLVPSIDLKTVPTLLGERIPIRLSVDGENPVLLQMGPKAMQLALASRAREYLLMHTEIVYTDIRRIIKKNITAKRSTKRSDVLEKILGMQVTTKNNTHTIVQHAQKIVAPSELGYIRTSSERKVSRKKAAREGLLSLQAGLPTMPIALGGMPPTTGSVDSVVTAAMSYMRSWIPHNGIFAGNFERQLQFFEEAKKKIQTFGLPKDIEKIVIRQIGLSVGGENPAHLSMLTKEFKKAGGYAIRIYTTNPGLGIIEAAMAIRRAVGKDFVICVGPIVDVDQAKRLMKKAGVQMFIVGHGGGENCTSLEGGGAANAVALLYEMNIDRTFEKSTIGIEGGVGTAYGPLLSLVDFFSLNGKVVGGIEPTGGLFVKHKSGLPMLPYHGSASVVTQKIEAFMDEKIRSKRLGDDGMVENVEGKPNYKPKKDWANSMVNYFQQTRAYLGLALADMDAMDIFEFRQHVAKNGHNIVEVSTGAHNIAFDHRKLR